MNASTVLCFVPSFEDSSEMMSSTQSGSGLGKIRHIVEIRQMVKQWRKKASKKAGGGDVPAGYVAVCVGTGTGSRRTRFVVPATYLNHPIFKQLLAKAEEEFGFTNVGPLTIPCDETLFHEVIRVVSGSPDPDSRFRVTDSHSQRCCHVDVMGIMEKKKTNLDLGCESRPLLHHFD